MGKALKPTDTTMERLKKLVPVEVITLFGTVAAFFGLFEEIIYAQVAVFVVMGAGAIIGYCVENKRWDKYIQEKQQENLTFVKKKWAIFLATLNGVVWIFLVSLRYFQQSGGLFVMNNDLTLIIQIAVACLIAFSGFYKGMDQTGQ